MGVYVFSRERPLTPPTMKSTILCCIVALSLLLLVREATPLGSGLFGIDLGTDTFRVMTMSANSPSIVLNDQSGRKTPSLVGFTREGERVFGSRAAQLAVKFPDRVISSAHQFLGKSFPDPEIEAARHLFTFRLVENNGFYAFQVDETIYTPEEIVAMLIEFAHNMASEETRSKLTDCVLTVSPSLTQPQRQGYINAARIAGVNVALLATEGVSTAVDYLRSRLLSAEDLDQHVIFVDVGSSHTSATLAQFQIQRMKDQSINRRVTANYTTWAPVGGRDFDHRLTRLLQQKAEAQFDADFSENQRVMARLRTEARKAKEVLTVNKEARVRIESLHADRDFSSSVTIEELEEACQDLIDRVVDPIRQLVENVRVPLDEVEVEIVGGGSRLVKINTLLTSIFGDRVGRHLNGDEAALQGAMVYAASSSAGKRATVTVRDSINYPVDLIVDLPSIEGSTPLFSASSRLRTHKNKNVLAQDSFSFDIVYPGTEEESEGSLIGSYEVSGFPNPDTYLLTAEDAEAEMPTVKLRFEIDARGLIECTEAAVRIEEAIPSTPTPSPTPEAEPVVEEAVEEAAEEAADANATEQENNEEATATETAEEDVPAEPVEQTDNEDTEEAVLHAAPTPVPTRKRIVPLTVKQTASFKQSNEEDIISGRSLLARLTREDKTRRLREATKNDIESYVYATLDLLEQEEIRAVSTEEELESLANALMEAGDWIYDDGSDASLEEYETKLYGLRSVGDRIVLRSSEAENRPKVSAAFHEWKQLAMDALKDIVTERMVRDEEKQELVSEIEALEQWLEEQQEVQSSLQPHEDPVWLTSDLTEKIMALQKSLGRLQRRRIRTPTPSPTPSPSPSPSAEEPSAEDPLSDVDFDTLNFDNEENEKNEEVPVVETEEMEEDPTLGEEDPVPLDSEDSKKPAHEEL